MIKDAAVDISLKSARSTEPFSLLKLYRRVNCCYLSISSVTFLVNTRLSLIQMEAGDTESRARIGLSQVTEPRLPWLRLELSVFIPVNLGSDSNLRCHGSGGDY